MVEKTKEFKQLVELLKTYEELSEVEITAELKAEDKTFEFSNGKIKKAGK